MELSSGLSSELSSELYCSCPVVVLYNGPIRGSPHLPLPILFVFGLTRLGAHSDRVLEISSFSGHAEWSTCDQFISDLDQYF